MGTSTFDVVRQLEQELCGYTGAPYAVTTNSCTMAILLAVAWHLRNEPNPHNLTRPTPHFPLGPNGWREVRQARIEIPKRTYVSVPMSIIHAGGWPTFRDEEWVGAYQLKPLPVWDCARRFTGEMYSNAWGFGSGRMQCVSFHASKILGDSQGGAILHSNPEADEWFRRARFDGRTEGLAPKDDKFIHLGWHCYMSPDVAARLLWKLSALPRHNEALPNSVYPDLSQMEIFQ